MGVHDLPAAGRMFGAHPPDAYPLRTPNWARAERGEAHARKGQGCATPNSRQGASSDRARRSAAQQYDTWNDHEDANIRRNPGITS